MATYGLTFYGTDKYGPTRRVEFDVQPFVVEAVDYDHIQLTWTSPHGNWTKMRILRNWMGFSVDENDGEILTETNAALASFADRNIRPGAWHYYAIWIFSPTDGRWHLAGTSSVLMVADHGHAQRMYDSLPTYHQLEQGAVDDLEPVENDTLHRFLKVLAVGLNYLSTYYDSLLLLNDPMRDYFGQLLRLGEQFGIEYAPVTQAALHRAHVRNAGTLARERGTSEYLRSLISLTVGWDCGVTPGANLMLSEDTASFVHPVWPEWDPALNYSANETVTYLGYLYKAKPGGAYGDAQKPTGTSGSNTWWTWVNNVQDTTYSSADGTVAGWGVRSFTPGVPDGDLQVGVGLGMQSSTDPTVNNKNTLYLKNPGTTTADMGALSVGADDVDQINGVKRGVPVPHADREWDETAQYQIDDYVSYNGQSYRAISKNVGVPPTGVAASASEWQVMGYDTRVGITGSLYVKGGDATMQARLAYPVMEFFDDKGIRITTVDTSLDHSPNQFDAFSGASGTLAGRSLQVGGGTWTTVGGTWQIGPDGYVYPTGTPAFAYITGQADGQVSVTFQHEAAGTATQAVVIRFTGGSIGTGTYTKATHTGIYSVSAGTPTLLATYPTPFADGDRITVSFVGTTIKVYRNGTLLSTVTSAVNSTAVIHGMLVA